MKFEHRTIGLLLNIYKTNKLFKRTRVLEYMTIYTHKKSFASPRFHKFRNLYIQREQRSTQTTFQLFLLLMKTIYCIVYHHTDRLSEVVVQIAIYTSASKTQQHVLLHYCMPVCVMAYYLQVHQDTVGPVCPILFLQLTM